RRSRGGCAALRPQADRAGRRRALARDRRALLAVRQEGVPAGARDAHRRGPRGDAVTLIVHAYRRDPGGAFVDLEVEPAPPRNDDDARRFRIENVREAIRIARAVPDGAGGVYIG